MAENSPYARDLGYLDKFIARLEGDAASLPADHRERALALLAAERQNWSTIMSLLAGEPVAQQAETAAATERMPAEPAAPKVPMGRPQGLTVGSLIGQP